MPGWELVACGMHGHELIGTDVARLRDEDDLVVRKYGGLRWYRCLRCDSWQPEPPPAAPTREVLPPREQIAVPLRGRPLRDRYVLRLIAVDRILHFLIFTALGIALFVFAHDRAHLRGDWTRFLNALQAGVASPLVGTRHGWIHDINHLFDEATRTLNLYAVLLSAYAALNLVEAVGLWRARRWAEYLAAVEVTAFIPIEIHELVLSASPLKVIALIVNIAIVAYLLVAHRLFGLRGGGAAYRAERERDSGWPALERTAPG